MKSKAIIISLIFFSFGVNIFAQSDSTKKATSVVVFGDESNAPVSKKGYSASGIKIGLFDIVQGMYGFYYERELSDIFSVQGGLGLTGRNFLYGLGIAEFNSGDLTKQSSPTFVGDNDIYDEDFRYNDREAKIGYFVNVMPKFYYADEDGFDGTYIGFNFQYRRYNYLAYGTIVDQNQDEFVTGSNDIDEFENQTILALTWGRQNVNDKTLIDYHFGFGFRSIKGERRDVGLDTGGISNTIVVSDVPRDTKNTYLFVEAGLKIGLWWKK